MPETPEDDFNALPRGTRLRVLVLITAALVLVFTLVWLLSGGGAEFFYRKIYVHAYVADSAGLTKSMPVMLNGVQVGQVQSVRLANTTDNSRAVRMDLKIEERYGADIPVDSIAAVTATNLIGDEYVNISAGKSLEHVGNGSEIASLVQSGSFNPADLVVSLQATIDRVNTILDEIQQGDTPLAEFVRGNDLYRNLLSQVLSIQHTIRVYADPKSVTGKMLINDEFYNQLRQPILNIDHALEQIQRGENPTGKLINDPSTYDNAVAQMRTVHQSLMDARAGKGPMGQMLESDDQYRQLQAQVHALDQSVEMLTHGEGAFAQLLQSSQLYDALNGQSRSARVLLHDFRDDPQKFLRIKLF